MSHPEGRLMGPDPRALLDPAQLLLGVTDGVPFLAVEPARVRTDSDEIIEVPLVYREPPLAGDTRFDEHPEAWGPMPATDVPTEGIVIPVPGGMPTTRTSEYAIPSRSHAPVHSALTSPIASPPAPTPAVAVASMPTAAERAPVERAPVPPVAPSAPTPVIATPAIPALQTGNELDELRGAVARDAKDSAAAQALAMALDRHGDPAGAHAVVNRAVASGADEVAMLCVRAALLGARLRYDEAESELKRAIKLRADDPEVQLQVGILACRRARWKDAVEPLQRAAAARTDSAIAQYHLGEALNHVDQLAPALAAFERAATLDASHWRAWKGVGIVLDRLGRPADAAVAYRRSRDAQRR
ncbi:MAG: tetratricopeptide repeat protein [Gemmatimonadaceae bacterium]|nr:tetratricopeptide repeat protein [Gemmatimonadaceae bacterium]